MISEEQIDGALGILEHASKGPALWVEPVTGVEHGKRCNPYAALERLIDRGPRAPASEGERGNAWPIVHGVSIPCDGKPVDSIRGGDHLVVAITGNGPTSETNARAIACMFNPEYGYAAALIELRRIRIAIDELERSYATGECDDMTTMGAWRGFSHALRSVVDGSFGVDK